MSIIDGLTGPTPPAPQPTTLRAPDLALLREIVQQRSGWRLGRRHTASPQDLLNRLLQCTDRVQQLKKPRIRTSISVFAPNGRRAVAISV